MRDIASPFDGFASPFGPQRSFNPASLFGSIEGLWFNFADQSSLYQDNLAATPLTAPDQWMKLAADRSRNRSPITVAAALQANTGLSPKWGRAPKVKRNLLTYSEEFDNAAWQKGVSGTATAPVVTPNAALDPNGEMTADLVQLRLNGAVDGSFSWLYQNITVPSGATRATSFFVRAANPADIGKVIRLTGATNTSVSLTADWQRISNSALVAVGAVFSVGIRLRGFESTADSVDLHLWTGQFEDGATITPPQKTRSAFDTTESGFPSYGFIRPDLVDDVLTATMPAAQTGDVAVFGRTASKIESGISYLSGASLSIGSTTVTGMSAGVLSSVGDVVGVLAIGRALTTAEKATLLAYYQARGAGIIRTADVVISMPPRPTRRAQTQSARRWAGGRKTTPSPCQPMAWRSRTGPAAPMCSRPFWRSCWRLATT